MHRTRLTVAVVLVAGLIFSLYGVLPQFLLQKVNQQLQTIPGYSGHVQNLKLQLLPLGITLQNIRFAKREETAPGAFVSAAEIRIHFSSTHLLRRQLVMNVSLQKPEAVFLLRQRRVGEAARAGVWQQAFARCPPFRIDRLDIENGLLRFKNDDVIPPLDVHFDDVQIRATHLANDARLMESGLTELEGRAHMQNQAPLQLTISARPFSEHATFTVKGTVKDFKMTSFNDVVRFYTGLELAQGTFDMDLNLTARDGEFQGEVHRSINDLQFKKPNKGLLKMFKANIAQVWLDWKEDGPNDRIQKRFAFSGPLGYIDQDPALAAIWVAKGAFIQSIKAKLDDKVRLDTPEAMIAAWSQFQETQRKKAGRKD